MVIKFHKYQDISIVYLLFNNNENASGIFVEIDSLYTLKEVEKEVCKFLNYDENYGNIEINEMNKTVKRLKLHYWRDCCSL